jgi:sensor histidine kinase YesM
MHTLHAMQVQQTKFVTENRIKLEISRAEMRNDELYEATNQLTKMQESLIQLQEECETGLEKKRKVLENEGRQDR